ncbi:hypothetical protein ALC57_16892 [Trachymyrmex cornetzi]|uniref:Uncharacterized protein n=1 Tax=Trachymyrmex cornetzi TaxID=471704 RepID=A0A151IU50_9HYME|nr:hypothetical protein ALC57_16892 [Trachymyrmex cornetzi]
MSASDEIATTSIDVSGAVSPIPLTRERSITTTPIAKLLSQVTCRDRELTSERVAPCSLTEAGPVAQTSWSNRSEGGFETSFRSSDVTEIPRGSTRLRKECEYVTAIQRDGSAHVISEYGFETAREPRARPVLAILRFFFSIRASRTIEQRLASTTRFWIVVCGRSTSPKRKVTRTATTRSHYTPCLYVPLRTRSATIGYEIRTCESGRINSPRKDRLNLYHSVLDIPFSRGEGDGIITRCEPPCEELHQIYQKRQRADARTSLCQRGIPGVFGDRLVSPKHPSKVRGYTSKPLNEETFVETSHLEIFGGKVNEKGDGGGEGKGREGRIGLRRRKEGERELAFIDGNQTGLDGDEADVRSLLQRDQKSKFQVAIDKTVP